MATSAVTAVLGLTASLALMGVSVVPAGADVRIQVSKASQRMVVSVNGVKRHSWTVSTARAGGLVTPSGTFHPSAMKRMHYSRQFNNEAMPYAIFFSNVAIHGTDDVARLGRPVSHGCVRLSPANAASLYALVERDGLDRTTIEIQ
jgi:lipoprotein-anchoring transpeptidase ErfK/SrfK